MLINYSDVLKLYDTDPFLAEKRLKELVELYPDNYYMLLNYVILLTKVCKIDEAEENYNKLINYLSVNNSASFRSKNINGFSRNLKVAKLKILCYREKYQELLDYLNNDCKNLNDDDKGFLKFLSKFKLGLVKLNNSNSGSYRCNQINNYSDILFRKHLLRHLSPSDESAKRDDLALFGKDFPAGKVISEVRKNLLPENKLFCGYIDDTYFFKYNNCGYVGGQATDYFKVVCIHNTKNILTMYPTLGCDNLPYLNLSYIDKNNLDNKPKTKTLSQVDKFKQRYNLK